METEASVDILTVSYPIQTDMGHTHVCDLYEWVNTHQSTILQDLSWRKRVCVWKDVKFSQSKFAGHSLLFAFFYFLCQHPSYIHAPGLKTSLSWWSRTHVQTLPLPRCSELTVLA